MKTEIKPLYHHQHVLSIHGDDGTEFNKFHNVFDAIPLPQRFTVF